MVNENVLYDWIELIVYFFIPAISVCLVKSIEIYNCKLLLNK